MVGLKSIVNFRPIDIRLSTLPTIYGEKIVMRILDLSSALNDLDGFGFSDRNLQTIPKDVEKPNGIILITGPTGSGKSSTLYAALNHLNNEEVNIITVEDPVEYQLEGVNQIQVREEVGLTFAAGLTFDSSARSRYYHGRGNSGYGNSANCHSCIINRASCVKYIAYE